MDTHLNQMITKSIWSNLNHIGEGMTFFRIRNINCHIIPCLKNDISVERLAPSPVMHASWVRTCWSCVGFSEKYLCFFLVNVITRSR